MSHSCDCFHCQEVLPKENLVESILVKAGEGKKEFDWLREYYFYEVDDLCHANLKLNGNWPGWEWIIEEKKKRGLA